MFLHNIDPVIFSLGPLSVRYYGLFYALGFVIAYFLIYALARRKGLGLSRDDVGDCIFSLVIGVVIGARLFYVLSYNLPFYLSNPLEIFALWRGGLSFHGGLIGGIAATFYFCRNKKLRFYDIADIAAIPLALGLALGRIGNFINGELYGRMTTLPLCIDYSKNQYIGQVVEGCRHASQLYESFYSLVIFTILLSLFLSKKELPKGMLTWLFVAMYGFFRTATEFFRQPDAQLGFLFGGLTMGQLLSIPMFVIGSYIVWRIVKTIKYSSQ